MDEDQHAFVTYTSLKEAQTAARATNGAILAGERITAKVEGYSTASLSLDDCTVKVENLSNTTSEETLDDVFGFFGDVEIVGIKITTPAIGSNYAYVYYSSAHDAQRSVSECNGSKIDESVVQVKIHPLKETLQVDCEPLIVRTIMSPDRPEYRTQFQTIERTNLVTIEPMKNEQGFNLKGNKERLEEVKSHLELVISKVQERLGDEDFTLPCNYIPLFADCEAVKQIFKIEHKYCVEFFVFDSSTQQSVGMSAFSQHVSAQHKSHTATSAVTECVSSFTCTSSMNDTETHLNFRVHGLKENLKQALLDLKEKVILS